MIEFNNLFQNARRRSIILLILIFSGVVFSILAGLAGGNADQALSTVIKPVYAQDNAGFDPEKAFTEAAALEKVRKLDQAGKIYEEIISKAPASSPYRVQSRVRLGEICFRIGEYEPAIRELKAALDENPPEPGLVKALIARCYLASDRPTESLKYISQETDKYSPWGTHRIIQAQAIYAQYLMEKDKKYLEELKTKIEEGIKESKKPLEKYMLTACSNLLNADFVKLEDDLENAGAALEEPYGKDYYTTYFVLGALKYMTGDKKRAVVDYNRIYNKFVANPTPESAPEYIFSMWALSRTNYKSDDFDKLQNAIKKIKFSVRDPETADLLKNVGNFVTARQSRKPILALPFLENLEKRINDESIEGDFFFDRVTRPFILGLIYREMSGTAWVGGNRWAAEKYRKMGEAAWNIGEPQRLAIEPVHPEAAEEPEKVPVKTKIIKPMKPVKPIKPVKSVKPIKPVKPVKPETIETTPIYSPVKPIDQPQVLKVQTGGAIMGSPVVVGNTVYVGSLDSAIYSVLVSAQPAISWKFKAFQKIFSAPARNNRGSLFFGCQDGKLYAINSKGVFLWKFRTGGPITSTPSITDDGQIIFNSQDGFLYSVSQRGILLWRYPVKNKLLEITSSPLITPDGLIITGSEDGGVYAISKDGNPVWNYMTGDSVVSKPVLISDNRIIVGSLDHNVYCLSSDGNLLWKFRTAGPVESTAAYYPGRKRIYVGSSDRCVYCIDDSGQQVFKFATGGPVNGGGAVDAEGNLYIGSEDGFIYSISPGGGLRWKVKTGGSVFSTPALGKGFLVVGSEDKALYILKVK